ncbi:hypothetical protein N9033_00595 [bacterium]|nr:hypothetical protein [bacterium]
MDKQLNQALSKLEQSADNQSQGVSKKELYAVIDDKFADTLNKLDTYRQVEDTPQRVNIVDISDTAKKKLENLINSKSDSEPTEQLDPEQIRKAMQSAGKDDTGLIQKIGDKLLDWAGDILNQVFKLVGTVFKWTVDTFMGLLQNVSQWIVQKIQVAVGIGAARGAVGGLSAVRGRTRAMSLLAGGLGAGGLALGAWSAMEGMDKLDDFASNTTSQVNQLFPDGATFTDAVGSLPVGQLNVTDDGVMQLADGGADVSDIKDITTPDTPDQSVETTSSPAATSSGASATDITESESSATLDPPQTSVAAAVEPEKKLSAAQDTTSELLNLGNMTPEQTREFYMQIAAGGGSSDLEGMYDKFQQTLPEGNQTTSGTGDTTNLTAMMRAVGTPPPEPEVAVVPDPLDMQEQPDGTFEIPAEFQSLLKDSKNIIQTPDMTVNKTINMTDNSSSVTDNTASVTDNTSTTIPSVKPDLLQPMEEPITPLNEFEQIQTTTTSPELSITPPTDQKLTTMMDRVQDQQPRQIQYTDEQKQEAEKFQREFEQMMKEYRESDEKVIQQLKEIKSEIKPSPELGAEVTEIQATPKPPPVIVNINSHRATTRGD